MRVRLLLVLFAPSLLSACGHKLESPAPSLTSLAPSLVCGEQLTTAAVITGASLTPVPSKTLEPPESLLLPSVSLTRTATLEGTATTDSAVIVSDDPSDPALSHVRWTSETKMSFDVTPGLLAPGVYDLTVTNPDDQAATLAHVLAVVPPPSVTSVVPPNICDAQSDQTMVVKGGSFLQLSGGKVPTVTIKDSAGATKLTLTPALSDCADVATSVMSGIQECATLTVTIPKDALQPGTYTIVVTNPEPANCTSTLPVTFVVEPPPTIDTVIPAHLCAGGGSITLNGTGYLPDASVSVSNATTPAVAATSVVVQGPTVADATFGGGTYNAGDSLDVTLRNADGCFATKPNAITVLPGPVVFYVDPPYVFGGITTPLTIYTTTFAGTPGTPLPAGSVILTPAGGGTPIDLSAQSQIDPAHPKHIVTNLGGTVAAGTYDLQLTDGTGCPASFPAAVTVVTQKTDLKAIVPPFGYDQGTTPVTITANAAFFQGGARAYLAPNTGANPVVTALTSVVRQSPTELSATVVPPATGALADGVYDVIVVNPDGTIGFLESGFTVVAARPPEVGGVSPGSLPTNCAPCNATLTGANFTANASVTATCGTGTPVNVTVSSPTATTLSMALPFVTSLPGGTVCTFRVTQGTPAVYADGGTLVVTIPSANLAATTQGPDLGVARRAPAVAINGPTAAARYLYVLGGDDGTQAGALASVEMSKVDVVRGGYTGFSAVPAAGVKAAGQGQLNGPRTMAGAVSIGRFIYLVGGQSATASVATVERSEVLDPAEAPKVTDADLTPDPTDGLSPGLYFYRVAAVMDATDPNNPNGESLASDEFAIKVPAFGTKKIQTTIVWTPGSNGASHVAKWRVYRTSAPDAAPGSEDVVYETAAATPTNFVDKGATLTPFTAGKPLPFGSLGTWKAIGSLTKPRAGAGVTLAQAGGHHFIYAGYGYDSTAAAANQFPNSYDVMQVDLSGNTLTETAWQAQTIAGSTGRWQLGAYTASPDLDPKVGATTYVYFGTGVATANGTSATDDYNVGSVPNTGVLAGLVQIKVSGTHGFGYGAVTAVDTIFQLGGNVSGGFTDKMNGGTITTAPSFGTFNPQGGGQIQKTGAVSTPLYLPGALVGGAYFFIVGGATGTLPGTPSRATFFDLY